MHLGGGVWNLILVESWGCTDSLGCESQRGWYPGGFLCWEYKQNRRERREGRGCRQQAVLVKCQVGGAMWENEALGKGVEPMEPRREGL